MADDQNPKSMDINDLVRELSKSSTSPSAPTPPTAPQAQAPRPSFPTPKPPMPPTPPMAGSPSAPLMPKPVIPMTPIPPIQPKPMTPPISAPAPANPPSVPGVKEYQSSIRTMNEDISKLKQGQKPMGVDVPRKIEQVVPVPQPILDPAKPTTPSQQFKVPEVSLGDTKKSAPLAPPKPSFGINVPSAPKAPSSIMPSPKTGGTIPTAPSVPKIYVPQEETKSGNRNIIFMGIGALVILVGFSYWFFVFRTSVPEVVIESPTPTPTEISTPTPSPLEKLGIADKVSISSTSVFLSSLITEMNARQPVVGQIKIYDIVDENQQKYSFKEFLTKLSIDTSTLNDSGVLDTREWVLGLYGQLGTGQGSSARPFIVLTQNNSTFVNSLMNTWESRITNDLAKLFNLNNPPSVLAFNSDVYSNINFRFVRIPDRDLGVAYAIFKNYLVLGSSRDSFRSVLDVLATP